MDIGDHMIAGTVVPKETAKEIFESEVRQMKNVSLVEHVIGNAFKTQVHKNPSSFCFLTIFFQRNRI